LQELSIKKVVRTYYKYGKAVGRWTQESSLAVLRSAPKAAAIPN
jgi:hypothetical protein